MNAGRRLIVAILITVAAAAGVTAVVVAILLVSEGDKESGAGGGGAGANSKAPEIIRRSRGPGIASGGPPGVFGQTPGLTLNHNEIATLDADEAFVVFVTQPPQQFSPGPPPQRTLSEREKTDILAALGTLGVAAQSVDFHTVAAGYGGPASLSVRVAPAEAVTLGPKIVEAIQSVLGAPMTAGVGFGLSDCTAALATVRQKALSALTEDAKAFAQAASLTLGPIVSAGEGRYYNSPWDPCDSSTIATQSVGAALNFGAKPEVQIGLNLSVTYSLGATAAAGQATLTAVGVGSVSAKADEAYVIVTAAVAPGRGFVPYGPQPSGPPSLSSRDRRDLEDGLKELELPEGAVQIATPPNSGLVVVAVEGSPEEMQELGDDVVRVMEFVFGAIQSKGAFFGHSNCQAVLDEARKEAIADAAENAKSLAAAAGVKLGSVQTLAETYAPNPYGKFGSAGCGADIADPISMGAPYPPGLQAFDAAPEFSIQTAVVVSYGIAP